MSITIHSSSEYERGNRIQAIKTLRKITSCGLMDAKTALENMPYVMHLPEYLNSYRIAQELNDSGFRVNLTTSESAGEAGIAPSPEINRAFKNLLIALVEAEEYEKMESLIKFFKGDFKVGNSGRTLEEA